MLKPKKFFNENTDYYEQDYLEALTDYDSLESSAGDAPQ